MKTNLTPSQHKLVAAEFGDLQENNQRLMAENLWQRALITRLRDSLNMVLWLYRGDSPDEVAQAKRVIQEANSHLRGERA